MRGFRGVLSAVFKKQPQSHFLIAGLGNPGREYLDTRHNVGHMVVDQIVNLLDLDFTSGSDVEMAQGRTAGKNILVVKPTSFVNNSGQPIKKIATKQHISPDKIIIIHDDLDLAFGEFKVKLRGGSGGHRGLDSAMKALDTDEFVRIRVGIGRPPGRKDPADFVLSPFTTAEWPEMEVVITEVAEAVLAIVRDGPGATMNEYNKK